MSTDAYGLANIEDIEDVAPGYGMDEAGECRPLTKAVGGEGIGATVYRMKPGKRHGFGHAHERAEEMYVVLEGSGRVKLGDDIVELRRQDVVRVAPPTMREFEAGPDGMALLAFGHRAADESTMDQGFWPEGT